MTPQGSAEHNDLGSSSSLGPLMPAAGYMEAKCISHVSHTFSLSTTAVPVGDRMVDKLLWSAPAWPPLGSPPHPYLFHIQAI